MRSVTSAESDRPAKPIHRPQRLEDLPRLLDAFAFALDANLAMPGQNLDAQRIADLPEVLVSASENRQLLGMSLQNDGRFRHALPLASQDAASVRTAKRRQAARRSLRLTGRYLPIMLCPQKKNDTPQCQLLRSIKTDLLAPEVTSFTLR